MFQNRRIFWLIFAALLLGGLARFSNAQAAAVVYVDGAYSADSAGGHVFGVDAFNNIQDGINAADSGGTVYVSAGTYYEQVLIQKSLTLSGAGFNQTIVKSPVGAHVSAPGYTVTNAWNTDYLLAAYSPAGPISVKVSGFGFDANNTAHQFDRFTGVYFRDVRGGAIGDAGLFDSKVAGFSAADPSATGIRVLGDSYLTLYNNFVDYTINGIAAYGDAGAAPDPNLRISSNIVTLLTPVDTTKQGIVVAFGAVAEVDNNNIRKTYIGILLSSSPNCHVHNNVISSYTTAPLHFVNSDPVTESANYLTFDQTITFGPLADKVFGDPDFTISASVSSVNANGQTVSSGLPVSFTASGSCTVSGNTVSIVQVGACLVTAHQPGDNLLWNPAPDVGQAFTVSAPPPLPTYTLNASAGANGSILPSGAVAVLSGGSQTFTISADAGYQIADVLVDGVSVGAVASYTFNNVTANHAISVSFSPAPAITTAELVLRPGWNLITLPLQVVSTSTGQPVTFTAESFGSLIGADTVTQWLTASQHYAGHIVGQPVGNFTISEGLGFFVHLTAARTVSLSGTAYASSSPALLAGWNPLGYNVSAPGTAEAFGLTLVGADVLARFDSATQQWQSHIMGLPVNNFTLNRGDGVFAHRL